jgi:hypothetical protein
MKNILKILLPYLLLLNFSYAITDCNSKYNCLTNARPPQNIATNITCTLLICPNLKIYKNLGGQVTTTIKYPPAIIKKTNHTRNKNAKKTSYRNSRILSYY